MRLPRKTSGLAIFAAASVWGGLLACAPGAWATNVTVNARAQIAVVSSSTRTLQFAGAVSDPGLGNGGLLATVHPAASGYSGTATIVDQSGSVTLAVRVSARKQVSLVRLSVTAPVTSASGRFAGGGGTLTGNGAVTATYGVGNLVLRERSARQAGGSRRRRGARRFGMWTPASRVPS